MMSVGNDDCWSSLITVKMKVGDDGDCRFQMNAGHDDERQ
jgi:hypothetical protein